VRTGEFCAACSIVQHFCVLAAVFEAARAQWPMESWRRDGSFRQRERVSSVATNKRAQQVKQRIAAQTHQAIADFEVVLKEEQEKANRDIDDLPPEAEAGYLSNSFRGFSSTFGGYGTQARDDDSDSDNGAGMGGTFHGYGTTHSLHGLQRSQSDPQVRPVDKDPCVKRPPSPCTFYDYGSLTSKPRSVYAQHRAKLDQPSRPKFRHSSCGFYFPGPQFRAGPYGFSMLDPCLMPPRSWASSKPPPVRYEDDAGDVRPTATEELGHKRNRAAGQVISDSVRSTNAHNRRAKLVHQMFDRNREDRFLEQARFENGAFEGRWRDPTLDFGGNLPEESPEEDYSWLAKQDWSQASGSREDPLASLTLEELQQRVRTTKKPSDTKSQDFGPPHEIASMILFGLHSQLQTDRQRISQLFEAENSGAKGVLEPKEFLSGLQRLGIVTDDITVDEICDAMTVIDPSYDGRVNLPTVGRAVAAANKVQGQRTKASQRMHQQHQAKLQTSYSESLPVEVVKVDRESRSLFNFERSFEKFRSQQRELLAQHNEV